MRKSELSQTALRALRANPKRSILSMLGIIIGIMAVITIMALGEGIKVETFKNLNTNQDGAQKTEIMFMGETPDEKTPGFNQADLTAIQNKFSDKLESVKFQKAGEEINLNAIVNDRQVDLMTGLLKRTNDQLDMVAGDNLSKAQLGKSSRDIILSEKLAKKYFKSAKQAIDGSVEIDGHSFSVQGVFKPTEDEMPAEMDMGMGMPMNSDAYMSAKAYDATHELDGAGNIELTVKKGQNASKVSKDVAEFMNEKGSQRQNGQYSFFDMGELLEGISKMISGLTLFIAAVAGISLLIAGIGVMNMMYISVAERTKEIGIRIAIGATQRDIMWQFLLEAIFLTITGGLIGFVLGYLVAFLISLALPFNAIVTPMHFFVTVGVSTLVGVIFGILPAKQAARKNIIDILK